MKYFKRVSGLKVTINDFTYRPDVVVIMRGFGRLERVIARFYRHLGTRVVWDTCVNYFETDGKNPQVLPSQVDDAHKMIRHCDAVFTSSRFINDIASKYTASFYLTDTIDKEHFSYWKDDINLENPVIGWSGFAIKAKILERYKEFLNRHRVLIIADKDPLFDLNYEFIKWDYHRFPQDILRCDIMFSPRKVDDMYNKGHSIFKVGVFLAEGIPVIADPIPSYTELKCPHLYLCDTLNTNLENLIMNIDKNKRVWDEKFSSENIMQEYYEAFKKVCSK